MRAFTVDFNGDRASIIGDAYELNGMQFLANPGANIGRVLDTTPNRIDHPFHLEMRSKSRWNPIYIYPLEREHVLKLAKIISSDLGCSVDIVASARILINYEDGVLMKEYSITDFYVMSEEEAKMYQL
jgi:hypothetical protein